MDDHRSEIQKVGISRKPAPVVLPALHDPPMWTPLETPTLADLFVAGPSAILMNPLSSLRFSKARLLDLDSNSRFPEASMCLDAQMERWLRDGTPASASAGRASKQQPSPGSIPAQSRLNPGSIVAKSRRNPGQIRGHSCSAADPILTLVLLETAGSPGFFSGRSLGR